jgi:hypothetical protein
VNALDLAPLAGWFNRNTSITNLSIFLYATHYNNSSLQLTGQTIFPNWIKTMKQDTTPLLGVSNSFSQMFYLSSSKADDTGEPKFEDGSVLSNLGTPNSNKWTYTGRNGISPTSTEWK